MAWKSNNLIATALAATGLIACDQKSTTAVNAKPAPYNYTTNLGLYTNGSHVIDIAADTATLPQPAPQLQSTVTDAAQIITLSHAGTAVRIEIPFVSQQRGSDAVPAWADYAFVDLFSNSPFGLASPSNTGPSYSFADNSYNLVPYPKHSEIIRNIFVNAGGMHLKITGTLDPFIDTHSTSLPKRASSAKTTKDGFLYTMGDDLYGVWVGCADYNDAEIAAIKHFTLNYTPVHGNPADPPASGPSYIGVGGGGYTLSLDMSDPGADKVSIRRNGMGFGRRSHCNRLPSYCYPTINYRTENGALCDPAEALSLVQAAMRGLNQPLTVGADRDVERTISGDRIMPFLHRMEKVYGRQVSR